MNRVLTDQLADTLLTQSPEGRGNLLGEGIVGRRIHDVGNPVVDSLRPLRAAAARGRLGAALDRLGERRYVLVMLAARSGHDAATLTALAEATMTRAGRTAVVLAVPAELRARLARSGDLERLERSGARAPRPLGQLDRLALLERAGAVVTDAGAVQEAASILGVRCFTLGATTDRPVTLTAGTNGLVGDDLAAIGALEVCPSPGVPCEIPLWDGHAGERAADALTSAYATPRWRPAVATLRGR